jgi:hypothetical protein
MTAEATDGELRWRSPPGWLAALDRVAALSFEGAVGSPAAIRERYLALVEVITQELPPSDLRDALITRLRELAATLLGVSGVEGP